MKKFVTLLLFSLLLGQASRAESVFYFYDAVYHEEELNSAGLKVGDEFKVSKDLQAALEAVLKTESKALELGKLEGTCLFRSGKSYWKLKFISRGKIIVTKLSEDSDSGLLVEKVALREGIPVGRYELEAVVYDGLLKEVIRAWEQKKEKGRGTSKP